MYRYRNSDRDRRRKERSRSRSPKRTDPVPTETQLEVRRLGRPRSAYAGDRVTVDKVLKYFYHPTTEVGPQTDPTRYVLAVLDRRDPRVAALNHQYELVLKTRNRNNVVSIPILGSLDNPAVVAADIAAAVTQYEARNGRHPAPAPAPAPAPIDPVAAVRQALADDPAAVGAAIAAAVAANPGILAAAANAVPPAPADEDELLPEDGEMQQ